MGQSHHRRESACRLTVPAKSCQHLAVVEMRLRFKRPCGDSLAKNIRGFRKAALAHAHQTHQMQRAWVTGDRPERGFCRGQVAALIKREGLFKQRVRCVVSFHCTESRICR